MTISCCTTINQIRSRQTLSQTNDAKDALVDQLGYKKAAQCERLFIFVC
jgi:hypothetical protein